MCSHCDTVLADVEDLNDMMAGTDEDVHSGNSIPAKRVAFCWNSHTAETAEMEAIEHAASIGLALTAQ